MCVQVLLPQSTAFDKASCTISWNWLEESAKIQNRGLEIDTLCFQIANRTEDCVFKKDYKKLPKLEQFKERALQSFLAHDDSEKQTKCFGRDPESSPDAGGSGKKTQTLESRLHV